VKTIIASAAALALALTLAGCTADSTGPVEGTTKPTTVSESKTPTPTPTPEAALGTRPNPFPVGTPGKHSKDSVWTFTWADTDGNAWPKIQQANPYNTAPAAGQSFVLASTKVAADPSLPAEGGDPTASFTISYVGSDGNSYTAAGDCGALPSKAWYEFGRMYPGASQDGLVCTSVPTAAVSGGTWHVQSLVGVGDAYFAGAK
jgi:hypothetical protein